MILVDTSIWIDHLRSKNSSLVELLENQEVATHSFIIGEVACGNLKNRKEILGLMQALPQAKKAFDSEVLDFIESRKLIGIGIGLIDSHLLASALISKVKIWTLDKRLRGIAKKLKVSYN